MSNDTSESVYGITPQPAPTCGIVNDALLTVDKVNRVIRGYERAEEDELRDMLSVVESAMGELMGWGGTGYLEDIRARATEIRAWGQEWKDLAKQHAPVEERV